jgi:pimeloyl-ACP methyl ester carboxylesterase
LRTVISIFSLLAIGYLAACAALFLFQRSLIYYPQPSPEGPPASRMRLPVAGADLAISVRAHEGPKALVYFGGNAEDVSASLPQIAQAFPDRAIYLMHYRGYGGSTGSPTEEALHQDALALYDKVHAAHPDILAMGRSLGTGVAVRLASQRPVKRLVLVTPYDSIQELAAGQFPFFPVRWLLRDKFDSGQHAPRLAIPTLIVLAEHDEVIPRASTEQLYARFAKGTALLKVIPATGHNTVSDSSAYLEALRLAQTGW